MTGTSVIPIAAAERADFVLSLDPKSETDEAARLLRTIAQRDVSWRVRAAAARHAALPTATVRALAQDACWRVREAAMGALVGRGADVRALAVREPCAAVALAALCADTADDLVEHASADVRARAAALAACARVRVLLADEKCAVRRAARENLVRGGFPLGEREVRRFVTDGAHAMLGDARMRSIMAYAEAVCALEDAGETKVLQKLARNHVRFARAFDLSRFPEDRVLPWIDKAAKDVGNTAEKR